MRDRPLPVASAAHLLRALVAPPTFRKGRFLHASPTWLFSYVACPLWEDSFHALAGSTSFSPTPSSQLDPRAAATSGSPCAYPLFLPVPRRGLRTMAPVTILLLSTLLLLAVLVSAADLYKTLER